MYIGSFTYLAIGQRRSKLKNFTRGSFLVMALNLSSPVEIELVNNKKKERERNLRLHILSTFPQSNYLEQDYKGKKRCRSKHYSRQ